MSDIFNKTDQVITKNIDQFRKPGVLTVRPGYQLVNGWVSKTPAIVVTVDEDVSNLPADSHLPKTLGNYPVDVRQASPALRLAVSNPALFGQLAASSRPETIPPYFPLERTLTNQPIATATLIQDAIQTLSTPHISQIDYSAPAQKLAAVTDTLTALCHASPDAGWPTLKAFLSAVKETLTTGLYDFTSRHILDEVKADLNGKTLALVLDHPAKNPTADQTDDDTHDELEQVLSNKLNFAWALERTDPHAGAWIFPNAYHIKVAVRDSRLFWLSSGNWNNSNQPDIAPADSETVDPAVMNTATTSDRDWHVIIDHPGLAATFEAYIKNDLKVASENQASAAKTLLAAEIFGQLPIDQPLVEAVVPHFATFFKPKAFTDAMTIQPLLTPDPGVYVDAILTLIKNTKKLFYMQTQYIHASDKAGDEAFAALIHALAERQQKGVDVKIIMSQWEKAGYLEQLQAAGIDLSGVRIQQGVHNKGMVVDDKIAVVSSQNWSADGVLRNRDAGVIITHMGVAQYFKTIFMHDWNNLAKQQTAN